MSNAEKSSKDLKNFWSVWFRLGLYDALVPINYDNSLKEAFSLLNAQPGQSVADFGCGSGRLLYHATGWLKAGGKLTLIDVDKEGLKAAGQRAKKLGVASEVTYETADLTTTTAFNSPRFDGAIAHFSLYTMKEPGHRQHALEQIAASLKAGAKFIVSVPSEYYHVKAIIADARRVEYERNDQSPLMSFLRRNALYAVTGKAMEKIERELDLGNFTRFTKPLLKSELTSAGFTVSEIKPTYGKCGYHAICVKS